MSAKVSVIASSSDGGQTWSPAVFDRQLRDPQCSGATLKLAARSELYFSNLDTEQGTGRHFLTLRCSLNDGASWQWSRVLQAGLSAYSDLAWHERSGRLLHIYENGLASAYDSITVTSYPPAWLHNAEHEEFTCTSDMPASA